MSWNRGEEAEEDGGLRHLEVVVEGGVESCSSSLCFGVCVNLSMKVNYICEFMWVNT